MLIPKAAVLGVLILGNLSLSSIAAPQKESLLIGPGDVLHVQVFDTPELDGHARVTDSGELPLVLGGNVKVAGCTPAEASRAVENVLSEGHLLLKPRVLVTIEEYATQKVTILGEVKAPGAYAINTPRSVLEVLTLAGGLSDLAERKIEIERHGTHERVTYFVSNSAGSAFDTAIEVNPGDTILVPKAGIVYVLGDVVHPGGYTMTNNNAQLTVLQLVARAGGTNRSAVPSRARLIRRSGGSYTDESLALSGMQKGKRADVPLQADDIVWIPFSYMRNFALNATGIAASVGAAAVYQF
jgi:polysaccharide biosynthesis/export protein